jgi:alpha-galactosidase/6-phospho-beta-glucosidase family protein
MQKKCPDAWVINYTNPEGAVCLALQKYTKVKSFGLCHGTPDTAHWLASEVFGVEPDRLQYRAAGINHLTWFTDLFIDGKDVYPQLSDMLNKSGACEKEPISAELLRIFGLYPAPGDRHVGEFYPISSRKGYCVSRIIHGRIMTLRWLTAGVKICVNCLIRFVRKTPVMRNSCRVLVKPLHTL